MGQDEAGTAKEQVMASFLLGILGGFIAWVTTWFVAQPLSTFFALRSQAAEVFARYEDKVGPNPYEPPPSLEWLSEREKALESCGASLVAYAASNTFMETILLGEGPFNPFPRYAPRSAGESLFILARLKPGTADAYRCRQEIIRDLKLSYRSSLTSARKRH
jgi:hypothetical protein